MDTINTLIANDKLEEAADKLYDGLLFLFNAKVPGILLSREEFAKVAPKLVAKLQNPVTEAGEKTEDPGDDIELTPSKGYLKVTFEGPAGLVPAEVNRAFNVGATYTYAPPTIVGYTADKNLLTGTMTAEGVEETIKYTQDAADESSSEDDGGFEDSESDTPASGSGDDLDEEDA